MNSYLFIALCVYTLVNGQEEVTECGVQSIRDMEVDGETVKAGTQPWRITVSLKRRLPDGNEVWESYCPGTLISPKHVLATSTYTTIRGENPVLSPSDVQLAAGQYFTNTYIDTVAHAQKRGVSEIIVHDPPTQNPSNNIRLFVADQPFNLSWAVNVACVDWTHLLPTPTPSDVMIIASRSHGVNDKRRQDVLSTQRVALISQTQAYAAVIGPESDTIRYQPDENFATSRLFYIKATNNDACFHPLGAGVLVAHSTASGARFYLIGVIYNYLRYEPAGHCYINGIHIVTNVVPMIDWIKTHVHPSQA